MLPTLTSLAVIGDPGTNRAWAIVLGVSLAVVAVALLVASWTRWGQTKSLTKCIALAFLAHVWLLMYAYGTRIIMPGIGGGTLGGASTEGVSMSTPLLMMEEMNPTADGLNTEEGLTDKQEPKDPSLAPWEAPLKQPMDVAYEKTVGETPKLPELQTISSKSLPALKSESLELELPPIETSEQLLLLATPNQNAVSPQQKSIAVPTTEPSRSLAQPATRMKRRVDQQPVPLNYQMRMSPFRQQFAMQNGGDVNTEAAVERALAWLARNQGPDGGWNAAEHGAGRATSAITNRLDNENRHNAGLKANTAMTGLSLLAFLGAGHTHTDGHHKDNVAAGLRYLLSQQFPSSGDLSGREQVGKEPTVRFARMYSHGMAALAITEAYGMTGDPALLTAIQAACQYSLTAMNSRTGGWRYEYPTDDPGDLSQFGWQAMLLNSASNNRSFVVPQQSRFLMQRFLDSVSTGRNGGLAVYRPLPGRMASPEQATPAMTAESLASRLLLGFPVTPQAAEEGQRMLLSNLPGSSEENLYYWYYATLAMYQLRGNSEGVTIASVAGTNSMDDAWKQWNDSLKQQLCSTQVPRGQSDGSWNPSCIWGGYGGRVYSTAFSCMCLEVYYRYLPMYKPEQFANQWQPARR